MTASTNPPTGGYPAPWRDEGAEPRKPVIDQARAQTDCDSNDPSFTALRVLRDLFTDQDIGCRLSTNGCLPFLRIEPEASSGHPLDVWTVTTSVDTRYVWFPYQSHPCSDPAGAVHKILESATQKPNESSARRTSPQSQEKRKDRIAECPTCLADARVNRDGRLRKHKTITNNAIVPCEGSGQSAKQTSHIPSREHTQTALLEAAERLWSERGPDGASLEEVAASAGLTKGAVYSNFNNKDELIAHVREKVELAALQRLVMAYPAQAHQMLLAQLKRTQAH